MRYCAPAIAGLMFVGVMQGCGLTTGTGGRGDAGLAEVRTADTAHLPDGNRRLGRSVIPRHYSLELTIDPAAERFSGRVEIAIDLAAPTTTLQLHGQDLRLSHASIEVGGQRTAVRTTLGANGALTVEFTELLPAGPAILHLAWSAPLEDSPAGLFHVKESGRWYAFTQFEPMEARKVFPCFDQPEFKTPYAVTLRVPSGQMGIANGPQIAQRSEEDAEVFVFAETKPLPTYLVAFAVGAFDIQPSADARGQPTRILSVEGKRYLAHYAAERVPVILRWLTDYFGRPYPFAKLDLIGVPNFGLGAMENAGLVTFRERLLLLDADEAPVWARRSSQSVIAHELAHMWFGDLVTMAWWDDLWLNESFATWMATKVLNDIAPELEAELGALSHTQYVMVLDSKRDARRIRQPIENGGDIYNAFDGITYGKGAAVLRMLEAWIGEEDFRAGVRAYMDRYAYGSGGTRELLAALAEASGGQVAEIVGGFIDQPGTPLVDVRLECGPLTENGHGTATLLLQQERYRPRGSNTAGGSWNVPVCVAYGGAKGSRRSRQCFLLDSRQKRVSLAAAAGCPEWLHPNAGERGYYHWSLPSADLLELVSKYRDRLGVAERVALPGHLAALVEADALSVAAFAETLTYLAGDAHHKVVAEVAQALKSLRHNAVSDDMTEDFAAFTRSLLQPHLSRVGLDPVSGESLDAQRIRRALLSRLADFGALEEVRHRGQRVAAEFVEAPSSVSAELVDLYLGIGAWDGDATLWEGLRRVVANPPSPAARAAAVSALGSFESAELVLRSLDLVLANELRPADYRTLAWSIRPGVRPAVWVWLTEHYHALASRLGPMTAGQLPSVVAGFCDAERHREVSAFFAQFQLEGAPPGTERNVRLALEDIERCFRTRDAVQAPLASYLREYAAALADG